MYLLCPEFEELSIRTVATPLYWQVLCAWHAIGRQICVTITSPYTAEAETYIEGCVYDCFRSTPRLLRGQGSTGKDKEELGLLAARLLHKLYAKNCPEKLRMVEDLFKAQGMHHTSDASN